MNKQIIRMSVVAMFLLVVGVTSTRAQNAGTVSVSVPFAFTFANKTLPAGEYYVRRTVRDEAIEIRSNDNSQTAYVRTHTVNSREIQPVSKLVFKRYGQEYFLSQVWMSGRSSGAELLTTKQERSLQREFARRATKTETIAINGKSN